MSQALIRQATKADEAFIMRSWLLSFRDSSEAGYLSNYHYYGFYTPLMQKLLNESTVLVAADPESPETIWGFLISNPQKKLVHYAYTKFNLRNLGIAKQLFLAADINPKECAFTFNTWHLKSIKKKLALN